jgi:hypothetical protein
MAKTKVYRVEMRGIARVKGSIRVEATSQKEAANMAKERSGDVTWSYTGLVESDESPEVCSANEE